MEMWPFGGHHGMLRIQAERANRRLFARSSHGHGEVANVGTRGTCGFCMHELETGDDGCKSHRHRETIRADLSKTGCEPLSFISR